jgi:hypothetical protein
MGTVPPESEGTKAAAVALISPNRDSFSQPRDHFDKTEGRRILSYRGVLFSLDRCLLMGDPLLSLKVELALPQFSLD